ncbi:MAG TPA: MFS transporter [Thermoanaerobaculia bacterium]|nr:MFS transporter [Thermoanaerobaculia bacterium]
MKQFSILWFGQLVSVMGSGLTGFALAVWVYQSTGSVTRFALMFLFTSLPGVVLAPVAGVLVDRWDRRLLMLASDTAAVLCTLGIVLLLWLNRLEVWHLYVLLGLSSIFRAVQWPAFAASITLLVPKSQYGRTSGMTQLGEALTMILAPTVAGLLMDRIGLVGVILIDVSTFVFAVLTLLVVRIPAPPAVESRKREGTMWSEIAESWTYLRERSGLLALLLLFAGANFAMAMVQVLFRPLVLSFTSAQVLGQVLSVASIGFLVGGLTMSVWGGPKRRVLGIYVFQTLQGLILLLAGLEASALLIAGAGFLFFFCSSVIFGSSQAIWQSKVAPGIQGRVFSLRRMVVTSTLPLAYLIAGPLADHVFEPAMAPGGALAASVGAVIGTGQGRGIALMVLLLGIWLLLLVNVAHRYRPMRRVEDELPDSTGEENKEARAPQEDLSTSLG